MIKNRQNSKIVNVLALTTLAALTLSGCERVRDNISNVGSMFNGSIGGSALPDDVTAGAATLQIEERDVEAPAVFEQTDLAFWDGRPSFGGVWAAVPGNVQPERVRIINVDTGQSTVGALFKREIDTLGPPIELSSDAASALGVTPNKSSRIKIVALRRETVDTTPAINPSATPGVVATTSLNPVSGTPATGTINTAVIGAAIASAPDTAAPAQSAAAPSQIAKPFIQVGTFLSAENAQSLTAILARDGVSADVRRETTQNGRVLHKVVVGPAASADAHAALMARVVGLGFTDAFAVAN